MKHTLIFKISESAIHWHHESEERNLFETTAGTADPNGTGWVSTGITFESDALNLIFWIERIVEISLEGKKNATIEEVTRLIDYLIAFYRKEDIVRFEQSREEY